MTLDYLNEFTPDWPHGHVLVLDDGTAKPFVVKVTNVPGDFPIWGYTVDGNDEPWRFRANGDNGYYGAHLRNVAPPKREPREVWVNYYPNRGRSVILDSRELAETSKFEWANAIADVVSERTRQIVDEGWTPEHDDAHSEGELARAGASYALMAFSPYKQNSLPARWPWRSRFWKPTTSRRDLVKAAALIIAEIERIDRKAACDAREEA